VVKASLSRMQTFIESGDRKIHEIQVRFDDLPNIFNKYDTVQSELELSDDIDHSEDRQQFELQYYEVKAKFNELLHPVDDFPELKHSSHSSESVHSDHPRRSQSSSNIMLPAISLPSFDGNTCSWMNFRDTFEALIVNNSSLSDVQRFHYLIASLKHDANDLISNLQITNENFSVAWQLVTQRYDNKPLIAMIHAKHLCQMPQVKKGDAVTLHQLINHVSSNINALQALSLNVSIQDLVLSHLILEALDADTLKEWETSCTFRCPTDYRVN
jgi:hypothetical protein